MKLYPCKIDMFPLENMAFSRRCSFPSSSRWRSALRELQKSSIQSSRAESGEGNLVVDPKLPWIMESWVIFFQWFGIFIVFFLEMILHWFFLDSGGCFRMIFSPMICSSRCVFQVAPHHPPLVQSWESFKKKQHKVQQIVSNFWFTAAEKKSHSWKDHENCC